MFYCDGCGKKNGWPEGFSKSYGPCEVCGKTRLCNDVPSSQLPEPRRPRRKAPRKKRARAK